MKISQNKMRSDYHLKNNFVIRYFNSIVFNEEESDKFDYNKLMFY